MLDATKFTSASLNLTLLDGRLGLNDLVLQAGGGQVAGDAAIEAEAGAAEIMVRLSASDIAVGDLLSDFGAAEKVMGEVDLDINIDSTGRSIDELMAELEAAPPAPPRRGASRTTSCTG